MPLTSGTRLGIYEIATPMGAGGIGEVYRARGTPSFAEVEVNRETGHVWVKMSGGSSARTTAAWSSTPKARRPEELRGTI